ncbi:MAG: hypothetical protein QW794_02900 [Thermosphaera sp.]
MSIRSAPPSIETNIIALLLRDPNIIDHLTTQLASIYVQTANFENGYLAIAQTFLGAAALRFYLAYQNTQNPDFAVFFDRTVAYLNGVLAAGTKALGGKTLIGVLESVGARRALETALLLRKSEEEGRR